MIKPEEAKTRKFDYSKDIERSKVALEEFIDRMLLRDDNKRENYIRFGLADNPSIYMSNYANEPMQYDFNKEVLQPVLRKYMDNGWTVFCGKFFSFINRDTLWFFYYKLPDYKEVYIDNDFYRLYP